MKPTAVIEERTDGYGAQITVWVDWPDAGVDRPRTQGFGCSNKKNAERLVRAIEAGVVFPKTEIRTDIHGKTYVGGSSTVFAKYLNADLKKLGF